MIPYSILSGMVYIKDDKDYEKEYLTFNVIELSTEYFSFRVPKGKIFDKNKIYSIILNFWDFKLNTYDDIILNAAFDDFYVDAIDFSEKYYDYIIIKTDKHKDYACKFTKSYMNYIDLKLYYDDSYLAFKLCKYPADSDDDYFDTYKDNLNYYANYIAENWDENIAENCNKNCNDNNDENSEENFYNMNFKWLNNICITLSDDFSRELFLKYSFDEFKYRYFEYVKFLKHPLSKTNIKKIAIGNQFCENLVPDSTYIRSFIDKCIDYRKVPILMLPPISQDKIEHFTKLIDEVLLFVKAYEKYCKNAGEEAYEKSCVNDNMKSGVMNDMKSGGIYDVKDYVKGYKRFADGESFECKLEIIVNDVGMLEYILDKVDNEKSSISQCLRVIVKKGVLFNKHLKDTRGMYIDKSNFCENSSKSDIVNLDYSDNICFVPYFQISTGTHCPLFATIRNKMRGKQVNVCDCLGYCKEINFIYPKHLNMIGRYNSIVGVNLKSLCDGKYLKDVCECLHIEDVYIDL